MFWQHRYLNKDNLIMYNKLLLSYSDCSHTVCVPVIVHWSVQDFHNHFVFVFTQYMPLGHANARHHFLSFGVQQTWHKNTIIVKISCYQFIIIGTWFWYFCFWFKQFFPNGWMLAFWAHNVTEHHWTWRQVKSFNSSRRKPIMIKNKTLKSSLEKTTFTWSQKYKSMLLTLEIPIISISKDYTPNLNIF